mmetsp:Transcript_63264/g.176019  ORF Transcript_63264/g.176019 Transcript_63264/m.176019 type:complete len:257 (-) Transcript_63264:636-1406(-)
MPCSPGGRAAPRCSWNAAGSWGWCQTGARRRSIMPPRMAFLTSRGSSWTKASCQVPLAAQVARTLGRDRRRSSSRCNGTGGRWRSCCCGARPGWSCPEPPIAPTSTAAPSSPLSTVLRGSGLSWSWPRCWMRARGPIRATERRLRCTRPRSMAQRKWSGSFWRDRRGPRRRNVRPALCRLTSRRASRAPLSWTCSSSPTRPCTGGLATAALPCTWPSKAETMPLRRSSWNSAPPWTPSSRPGGKVPWLAPRHCILR